MKAAFATVGDFQSADKAKDMFGFRRSTFQNTSSVLSDSKGGPVLGLDRVNKPPPQQLQESSELPSSSRQRSPNNDDI